MKKHDFTFIIGLSILFAVIWIIGELVMGLWVAVYPWVPTVWRIIIVITALSISVWHSFKYDENLKDSDDDE